MRRRRSRLPPPWGAPLLHFLEDDAHTPTAQTREERRRALLRPPFLKGTLQPRTPARNANPRVLLQDGTSGQPHTVRRDRPFVAEEGSHRHVQLGPVLATRVQTQLPPK